MVKSVIVLVILATCAVLSDSVYSEKEFIYLGSFKSKARTQEGRNRGFDRSNYFISVYPATWSNAEDDCMYVFGVKKGNRANHTLVAIESDEEWKFLAKILKSYKRNVWTSGIYDPSANVWRWAANDQILPPFAPWGNGFPSSNPNGRLRVYINISNEIGPNWRTNTDTEVHRYVCEVQKSTVPVPCYQANDLIIVIDSSGSIGPGNYEVAKDFVNELMKAFTVYKENRISLITYSNTATNIIGIKNTLTPAEFSSKILSVDYKRGKTKTNLGIDLAVAEFKSSQRKVPLNMVVLTDGMSNDLTMTAASATSAANLGIRTFSVGITPNINRTELLTIAGGDAHRIFTMAIFGELIQMLASISVDVCPTTVF